MPSQRATKNVLKPVSGFPISWGEDLDALTAPDGSCPVPVDRMKHYMTECHKHYCLEEPETSFDGFSPLGRYAFDDRTFWIWSCRDGVDREWTLIVGSGKSPFYQESNFRVFFWGARYQGKPNSYDVLISEFPEYKNTKSRSH
jgi:hypothetical protein